MHDTAMISGTLFGKVYGSSGMKVLVKMLMVVLENHLPKW